MTDILNIIFNALWFILPAYFANTAPVISSKFFKKYPISVKWLGEGKTWAGFFSGILAGTLVGFLQGELLLGFLLGFGAIFGDIVGSFIKRRIGLKRGAPAPLLDQYDFLIFALLFAAIIKTPSLIQLIVILILTPILHLSANFIAYSLKLKKEWW